MKRAVSTRGALLYRKSMTFMSKSMAFTILGLGCVLLPLSSFAESAAEVQKAMDASFRSKATRSGARLLASTRDGLETRIYEGSGELCVIKGQGETINVSIEVDGYFTSIESATLDLYAYDVDYPRVMGIGGGCCGLGGFSRFVDMGKAERDIVSLNGEQLGRLKGEDEEWILNPRLLTDGEYMIVQFDILENKGNASRVGDVFLELQERETRWWYLKDAGMPGFTITQAAAEP